MVTGPPADSIKEIPPDKIIYIVMRQHSGGRHEFLKAFTTEEKAREFAAKTINLRSSSHTEWILLFTCEFKQ